MEHRGSGPPSGAGAAAISLRLLFVTPIADAALRLQDDPLRGLKNVTPIADAALRLQDDPLRGLKNVTPIADAALRLQDDPLRSFPSSSSSSWSIAVVVPLSGTTCGREFPEATLRDPYRRCGSSAPR